MYWRLTHDPFGHVVLEWRVTFRVMVVNCVRMIGVAAVTFAPNPAAINAIELDMLCAWYCASASLLVKAGSTEKVYFNVTLPSWRRTAESSRSLP